MSASVVFMGTPEFAVPTLKALASVFTVAGVVTQPDKPRGRGRLPSPSPVKSIALELGFSVADPQGICGDDFLRLLRSWEPEVIVVAAYGKILPKRVLDLPPMGCVNLHASLLPRHRGASPISAALLAGDKTTGVCTILMDEGMDTGDILLEEEISIEEEDTAGSLHDKLAEPGARLVVRTLQVMKQGRIRPRPQDHNMATYCGILAKQDGLIDWQQDAVSLSRLVRAMNPWPAAFTYLSGQAVKVWNAAAAEGSANPGEILVLRPDGVAVGTGKGLLILKEIQAPGKKRLGAREFAMGRRLKAGDRFDSGR